MGVTVIPVAIRRRDYERERDDMTSMIEFEPIGYLTSGVPVWPVRGGEGGEGGEGDDDEGIDTGAGGDGDDDDEDDDDDGKGKKGDDAGKGKKYVAPTEDEWRRTQAALTRANGDAKRHRLKVRELSKPKEGETDAAQAEAEKRYKPVAIRSAAKAAFLEAGLADASPERVKKLLRMVDLDEVDVDADGDVTGLDEQIESVKDDYPELFKPAEQPRKRTTRLDASNRQTGGTDKPRSTGEKIAAAVLAGKQ